MSTPKRPVKVPTFDEALYQAGDSIRTRRHNITKATLALIDTIDELRTWQSSAEMMTFLRECGLSHDEVSTYTAFTPKLGDLRKELQKHPLSNGAIKALVAANEEAVDHALLLLEAHGRLGDLELAHLREVPDDAKTSDYDHALNLRDLRILDECHRLASTRAQSFTVATKHLCEAMKQHEDQRRSLNSDSYELHNDEFLDTLDDAAIELRERAWSERKSSGEALVEAKGREIVTLAKELLNEFDHIFPDAFVAHEDWVDVGNESPSRRYFAEARYALEALTSGGFSGGFPSENSTYDHWDALSSIAFLAGVRHEFKSYRRYAPRPARKLNAIIIGTASGIEALGLDAAGFRIRAAYTSVALADEVIRANRRDWNVQSLQIEDTAIAADITTQVAKDQTIHLLSGVLRDEAFKERGRGEHDARQQFTRAFQLLDEVKPEAFVFECGTEFLRPAHTALRTKLIWKANEMGFEVADIIGLDARSYGVPQNRQRSVIMGVKADRAPYLRQPFLTQPIKLTVGKAIAHLAFPYLREILATPREIRSASQNKYREWALRWLSTFGKKEWVPDTLGIVRNFTGVHDRWREEFGFYLGTDEVVEPHFDLSSYKSVPLTIPVLKRLQGIPDDWEFVGDYKEQVAQICQTIPPVISRVIGHTIHAALSGEVVDIDRAARTKIDTKRWKRAKGIRVGMAESDNPSRFREQEWRKQIQEGEAYWAAFPHME
ncbi:DNA cytosine methyltransferase [Ensifer sp. Root127]|uniref:DNA cytosine methyltransferase n=1 Tax=Ensifer sp. Root127 TaxID=1736440 RepID=UPI00070955A7|nr:DNA cytosine methyltransferase [Ensifer sp. Root127]KQW82050.1 hypothetical protein ASD03_23315 [Ensifer sp. Root127]